MLNETMVYNTSSSLTGLTNLSSQTGTIGTIFGSAILIGLIVGAIGSSHSWNTKGWLYKLVKWLILNVGENVLYGIGTTAVVGGIYYIGSELSKFGEANPNFVYEIVYFIWQALLVIVVLACIGWMSKPIWDLAYRYASGKKEKVVR